MLEPKEDAAISQVEPALGAPLAQITTQLAAERAAANADARPEQPAKRVLIIDDNRDAADSLALLLTLHGHEVRSLVDGDAGIDSAQSFSPDLVVIDLGFAGFDGYAAARRLRDDGCTARFAAITGYGRPEDRRRAQDAGFDDFFVKPVDPREIERLVGEPSPTHAEYLASPPVL